MNFTISGATPMGPVSFRRATAPAAAKKARDLSRLGLRDIRVVDEEGRAWALDELEGTGAPAPMKDTATRSQAFHGAAASRDATNQRRALTAHYERQQRTGPARFRL